MSYEEVMRKVIDVLNKARVKWCFIGGTALALFRDGVDDVDIDVGIFGDIGREELVRLFLNEGFIYNHGFGVPECGMQDTVTLEDINVDLFRIYGRADGGLWSAAWDGMVSDDSLCDMIVYKYEHFRPEGEMLQGRWIYLPSDPARFCEQQYGEDWQTPVAHKDWHYGKSAKNARYSGVYCRQTLGLK